MSNRTDWILDRQEAVGSGGVVAAKHPLAAGAGAEVLRRGGNAVDAAVTTAFAVGVVEPFMSGLGGGGFMVAHLPARGEDVVIDYSMVAPRAASPDMYRLADGFDLDLFGWRAVEGRENTVGHRSVAVPGTVAGLSLALERYGTISLRESIEPAIRLAEEGFIPTWHTVLYIALGLADLSRFPGSRATFTVDGCPPYTGSRGTAPLRQPELGQALRKIAAEGPRAYYEGPIARAIADEMRANGGLIDEEDLRAYRARVVKPLSGTYRDVEILATPTASGGPTMLEMLNLMEDADLRSMGHNSVAALHEIAEAGRQAFVDRYAYLADPAGVDVPVEALISKEYAAERRREFKQDRARNVVSPGERARLGVHHNLATSEPAYGGARMTTTHISVIDRAGNAVSVTQTLLSDWGSKVTVPGTGIVLNNGMMWFDPEPGRPNSVDGGKRPLANMGPVVLLKNGDTFASLGAMGGRKILMAVPQMISNLVDHGMGIQEAISAPRIDRSTSDLLVSDRLPAGTIEGLRELGHPVVPCEEDVLKVDFASPCGVLVEAGRIHGGANPYYPAMAIALP